MYRSKTALLPIQYYSRLPRNQACDVAFILDPCIATSTTVSATVGMLKRWGAKKIVIIAAIGSKEGVSTLLENHPDVDLVSLSHSSPYLPYLRLLKQHITYILTFFCW
jgi:uracil phosphoribosyltransferase